MVDGLSQKYGYAMQIAWRSDIEAGVDMVTGDVSSHFAQVVKDFTVAAGHHAITGKA